MSQDNNSGIQVFGGALNAQAVAVGAGASATVNNAMADLAAKGEGDVAATLQQILDAIKANGDALPDKAAAEGLVERIATEAAKKEPDKITMSAFLSGLIEVTKAVTPLATLAVTLAKMLIPS